MPAQILVVDPDPAASQLIGLNLERAGYRVAHAPDAEAALLVLDDDCPDLVLAEWALAGQSGIALARRIRSQPRTRELPLILLGTRSSEHDKVLALECGADDYVTKPFGIRELIARIHALLRRRAPHAAAAAVQLAGLLLDPATHRVTAGALQIALGPIEFRLLSFLMHHPERVHTRSQLLDKVWGSQVFLDERTVDTHVGRLRNALAPSGHHEHIQTVRGSGYRFVAWNAAAAGAWSTAA